MKPFLRLSGKVIIVLFCLWHIMAVGIYAIPGGTSNPAAQFLRAKFSPWVTPYMLWTSQWQQWNLFSPDPLRRVTTYVIEHPDDTGRWNILEHLEPGALPWWRHAAQFKMLGSLLDGDSESDRQAQLAERYLQLKCRDHALPDGMPVRLSYRYSVLPTPPSSLPVEWWWNYEPEETTYVGHQTVCNHSALLPDPT